MQHVLLERSQLRERHRVGLRVKVVEVAQQEPATHAPTHREPNHARVKLASAAVVVVVVVVVASLPFVAILARSGSRKRIVKCMPACLLACMHACWLAGWVTLTRVTRL